MPILYRIRAKKASPGRTHWQHPDKMEGYGICGIILRGNLACTINDPEFKNCVDCKSCIKQLQKEKANA